MINGTMGARGSGSSPVVKATRLGISAIRIPAIFTASIVFKLV
jgi:hypothetical protein